MASPDDEKLPEKDLAQRKDVNKPKHPFPVPPKAAKNKMMGKGSKFAPKKSTNFRHQGR